jgi:hypothetical protein
MNQDYSDEEVSQLLEKPIIGKTLRFKRIVKIIGKL